MGTEKGDGSPERAVRLCSGDPAEGIDLLFLYPHPDNESETARSPL